MDAMERLYKEWFLKELSRRWVASCETDLSDAGSIKGIQRQRDFYMNEVGPQVNKGKRAWVIISDALRFEVAAELADVLERETKGVCTLDAVQSVFPSITKTGMSALLPSHSYVYAEQDSGGFDALVDGAVVQGLAARRKALQTDGTHGVAERLERFVNDLSRDERRDLVGDAEVVYLYHNAIDAAGDHAPTEDRVFSACEDALADILSCVQLVVREFRAASVIVTADHGFLYTHEPLAETDKLQLSDISGTVVEAGRRYVVARTGAAADPLVPVALPTADGSLVGLAPRECVRIRKAGGGEKFVHGGISLQEMCVPVLRFANKRAGSAGYVESAPAEIELVDRLEFISNSSFTLRFLQTKPVGGKVLRAEYEVFVGDGAGTPVTDIGRVVADRMDVDATARTSSVYFSLRPGVMTSEDVLYHLFAHEVASGEVSTLCDLHIRVAPSSTVQFWDGFKNGRS